MAEFETASGVTKASQTDEQKLNALIGETFQPVEGDKKQSEKSKVYRELAKVTMKFITQAMNRRRRQQK